MPERGRSAPAIDFKSVDMPAPFVLHLGFDGWQGLEDRPSTPLAFGRHGVRLTAKDFDGAAMADRLAKN